MKTLTDQNGKRVYKDIRREGGGWGVNVWFGTNPCLDIRRYIYTTRRWARTADISDKAGQFGRIQ